MSDIAIRVDSIGKRYRIGERESYRALRDVLARGFAAPLRALRDRGPAGRTVVSNFIWALKDVSFEISRGETVGIIGRNGAGKSTLLKVLSRITVPTKGYAEVHGKIGALLEVGTGFHPELTGRENVYLNGSILGMRKKEIDTRFDEIVAFAEVEKFIDTPVKRYSSGMAVRLAFAVAAHLEPEIMLVDEVLAVGDTEFQKRCLGKMSDAAREGRTVVLVSHNLRAVSDLCERCLWLDGGKVVQDGTPDQVVQTYLGSGHVQRTDGVITRDMHVNNTGDVYFRRVAILDESGEPATRFFFGSPLPIVAELEVCRPIDESRLMIGLEKIDGTLISVFYHPDGYQERLISAPPGLYTARMELQTPLMPGGYTLHLLMKPIPGRWSYGKSFDYVPRALNFYVEEFTKDGRPASGGGLIQLPAKWDSDFDRENSQQ